MGGKVVAVRVESRRGIFNLRAISKNARGTSYTLRGVTAGSVDLDRATTRRNLIQGMIALLPAQSSNSV